MEELRQYVYSLTLICRMIVREGQAMSEYALIPAAIAVAAFLTCKTRGNSVGRALSNVIASSSP